MPEWQVKPLSRLVQFAKGRKVATSDNELDGYRRYLGAASLVGRSEGYADQAGALIAEPNDVLMLWDGERSGLVSCDLTGVVSSTVMRLRPRPGLSGRYLALVLSDKYDWIQARRTGTGVPHVPKDLGRLLRLNIPIDEQEQLKTCAMVADMDAEISQTEALIAKQEQYWAGLMQDLFNRGVDETGRLRPPREEVPELYHETALGWLPRGWETALLSERAPALGGHLKTGPFGSSLKISHWVETGLPVITIGSLGVGSFIRKELLYVGPETARKLHSYSVISGDIVFSRVADVGRSVVVDDASNGWIISSNLMRLRVDRVRLRPEMVHLQLAHYAGLRSQIRQTVNSGGRDVANGKIMNALRFLSPPIDEQDRIIEIARKQQHLVQAETSLLQKLHRQRTALLRDLLTPPAAASAEARIGAE